MDQGAAERAVSAAVDYGLHFVEIAMPNPVSIDAAPSRTLLESMGLDTAFPTGMCQTLHVTFWRDAVQPSGCFWRQADTGWNQSSRPLVALRD